MPRELISNPRPHDPQLIKLRAGLDQFYATTKSYPVFQSSPDNSAYYQAMAPFIHETIAKNGKVRVLELGCGLPTFTRHFAEIRTNIIYHAQDVTSQNEEYLKQNADLVTIGDISQITGEYDLIFSTFVLEHVSAPTDFLERIDNLLAPTGAHFIFCPRYDLPGYLCPSLRHQSRIKRWQTATFLFFSRLFASVTGAQKFWVNLDPAIFHRPFYRDADAVHIVSEGDVARWHRQRSFKVARIKLPHSSFRTWILARWLTLALKCEKVPAS